MQTLSATQLLRKRPRPITRCKGSQDKQTAPCTTGIIADGFLRHNFLPVYEPSPYLPDRKKVEQVYLKSIKNISAHYNIGPIDVSGFSYPYNILLANRDISRKMKVKGRYRELRIEENDDLEIQVSVNESVSTGSTLYYIPLLSLYKSLQEGVNPCAPILLGICVYLYRKAGVCHYKDEESYLCYLYDIMTSWIEDDREDMDEAEYKQQRTTLDEIFAVGDEMEKLLNDESWLTQLQVRIQGFMPNNPFEKSCVHIANETLVLWAEFPSANIYQHITPIDENDEDEYYGNGKIKVTDYISFIGETSSSVYDNLINMLNDDFNERSAVQDFEHKIVFNQKPEKQKDILAYEERVIRIIEELCDLIPQLI